MVFIEVLLLLSGSLVSKDKEGILFECLATNFFVFKFCFFRGVRLFLSDLTREICTSFMDPMLLWSLSCLVLSLEESGKVCLTGDWDNSLSFSSSDTVRIQILGPLTFGF